MDADKRYNILSIVLIALSLLIGLSLVSYVPEDLSFMTSSPNYIPHNYIKHFGAYLAFGLSFLLGWGAYLIPLLLIFWSVNLMFTRKFIKAYINFISFPVLFISFSTLCSILSHSSEISVGFAKGGVFGVIFSNILLKYFGYTGGIIVGLTLIILSLILSTEMLLIPFLITTIKYIIKILKLLPKAIFVLIKSIFNFIPKLRFKKNKKKTLRTEEFSEFSKDKTYIPESKSSPVPEIKKPFGVKDKSVEVVSYLDKKKQDKISAQSIKGQEKIFASSKGYKMPPLDLLDIPTHRPNKEMAQDLKRNISVLEEALADFGIEAKVVHVEHGPVVTLYELEPAPGVKVQKISNLSDDIALVMKAYSVRVVAPIPGKGTVGVEIPNSETSLVYLREILESKKFQSSESKLTLGLGKDISGNIIISDLKDMPHLLIAGATGSGKTVCVNTIIMSILFNAKPDEVKFIMIDPKMVELVAFNNIPHLLSPIVTSHKKVSGVLSWIVEEMERRYHLLAKLGVRDIVRYNNKVKEDQTVGLEGREDKTSNVGKLPYIVLVIDELADLMNVASREIEEAITRLAQLSRAVGIHMILATQRPSVDVITGTIKANFPARISFKVASKVDSRTVLDMNGADKLLGRGDMLFLKPRGSKLVRAQGSLVSDEEVERVVSFIRQQQDANYETEILEQWDRKTSSIQLVKDELYDTAVNVVLESGHASASMLQRRLRLGYTRAARLIDMMEEEGIVGPYRGSKAREILVNSNREE